MERAIDHPIGVEVDLPIVVVVAERADGERAPRGADGQDLDRRFWRREHVGDLKERLAQPNDRSFRPLFTGLVSLSSITMAILMVLKFRPASWMRRDSANW